MLHFEDELKAARALSASVWLIENVDHVMDLRIAHNIFVYPVERRSITYHIPARVRCIYRDIGNATKYN